MRSIEVRLGATYGRLEVIREVESSGKRRFLCRCLCGREVEVRLGHLRSGHTSSCGGCGVEYGGGRSGRTLASFSREYGIPESTLRARLKVMGLAEALQRGSER